MPDKLKWVDAGRGGELDDLRAKQTLLVKEKDNLDEIIAGEDDYLYDPSVQKKRVEAAKRDLPYVELKIQVINLKILIKGEPESSPSVQKWKRELELLTKKAELYEWNENSGPEQKRQELEAAIARLEAEAAGRP